jgi:hypothetical protein
MKISFYYIATMFCFVTAGFAVQAQENAVVEYEITDSERERYERDKVLFAPGGEGETRYVAPRTEPTGSSSATKKDTVSTAPAKPVHAITPTTRKEIPVKSPTKQLPPKQDEDAIMSFNFLYYIIQKYKLQEIIE